MKSVEDELSPQQIHRAIFLILERDKLCMYILVVSVPIFMLLSTPENKLYEGDSKGCRRVLYHMENESNGLLSIKPGQELVMH
jgi:hypothetical protein